MSNRRNLWLCGAVVMAGLAATPAWSAGKCIKAGGQGNGITEGIAQFMADAALKNSAKAWGGDKVKIGKVSQRCKFDLGFVCTATARACK